GGDLHPRCDRRTRYRAAAGGGPDHGADAQLPGRLRADPAPDRLGGDRRRSGRADRHQPRLRLRSAPGHRPDRGTVLRVARRLSRPLGAPRPRSAGGRGSQARADAVVVIADLLYAYAERIDGGHLEAAAALFDRAVIRIGGHDIDAAGLEALWRRTVRIHDDGTPRTKHVITN